MNSLAKDNQNCLSFLNFRTKPNVQKRKCDAELLKREWDINSAGFKDGVDCTYKKRKSRKLSTSNTKTLPSKTFVPKSKVTPSPARESLSFSEPQLVRNKTHHISLNNLKHSTAEENLPKQINPISTKRSSSVFLEVQNIQSSFQRTKPDKNLKPVVKLSSELAQKFKSEVLSKNAVRNNKIVPPQNVIKTKLLSLDSTRSRSNSVLKTGKGLEQFQDCVLEGKTHPTFKFSEISDFKINRDLHPDSKCINFTEFTQKIKSELLFGQCNKLQNGQNLTCKIGKSTSERKPHFKFPIPSNQSFITCPPVKDYRELEHKDSLISKDLQKENLISENVLTHHQKKDLSSKSFDNLQKKSFLDDKSIKAFNECSKKFTTNLISKKNSVKQVFENSFEVENLDIKSKIAIPSKSGAKVTSSSINNADEEKFNVSKRIKLDQGSFAVPSADFSHCKAAWKIKKINIGKVYSGDKASFSRVAKKSPIESCLFAANSESNFESIPIITSLKSNIDNEKSFAGTPGRSEITHSEFSKLLETPYAGGKGSEWMHSLKPEEEKEQWKDPVVKNIRNIVTGGFAEQLLKLQRRESSEKSIWNHKIQKKNGKALKNSLCLILTSTSYVEELVIVKASLVAAEESQASLLSNNGNTWNVVVVVFKRKAFARMHLKVRDVFRLYQPWQTIHLPSIPHPVILCAYFIDVISHSSLAIPNELAAVENIPVVAVQSSSSTITGDACSKLLKKSILREDATHGDMLFYRQKDLVTFSARVQRVWRKEFNKEPSSDHKYTRYSLLIQVKEGTFHELRILPDTVPEAWYNVISQAEGRCFRFHNLSVTHRTPMKRNKYLQDILKGIHQHNGGELMQEFCYQLMFDSSSKIPESINENGLPDYCPIVIEPLVMFSRKCTLERLTCIAKVLLKYKNVLYVSDQSLLDFSPSVKYTQVHSLSASEHIPSLVGSTVLIQEALIEEDSLLIDNYSQLIPLSESSFAFRQLSPENKMQVKLQEAVYLKNVVSSLHKGSQVSDIVYIQGEIASVNESTAVTWLQCCFCLQEKLVQDTNLVIYCEDCSRIVPKPILNVKLEVLVHCQRLASANVNVQLLSATTKRIMEIPESTYQPQCSISDVLGKEIGPLYCCVQSCDVTSDKPIFHLSEVDTS